MKKLHLLLAVILLLTVTSASSFAKDVGGQTTYGYIILPAKRDRWYDFRDDLNFLAVCVLMARGDSDQYYASEPLTAVIREKLEKQKTRSLYIERDAAESLLSEKKLFQHLNHVSLKSSFHNEECLNVLAKSYTKIRSLCISQQRPLSDIGLSSLTAFKRLEYLEINCQVSSPSLILESLPNTLAWLQIDNTWTLPALPKLQILDLNDCQLDQQFLEDLNADKLEDLRLNNVKLSKCSLTGLSRFSHLRRLYTCHCAVDEETRQYLRTFPRLRVQIQ